MSRVFSSSLVSALGKFASNFQVLLRRVTIFTLFKRNYSWNIDNGKRNKSSCANRNLWMIIYGLACSWQMTLNVGHRIARRISVIRRDIFDKRIEIFYFYTIFISLNWWFIFDNKILIKHGFFKMSRI